MQRLYDILIFLFFCFALFIKSIIFISFIMPEDTLGNTVLIPSIYIYITFIFAVSSFYFLSKSAKKFWYLYFINIILSVIMILDLVYYNGFSSFISLFHSKEIVNIGEAKNGINGLIDIKYFTVLIDNILILPIVIILSKLNLNTKRRPIIFILIMFICINCFYDKNRLTVFEFLRYRPRDTMITQSPLGYHIYDIYTYLKYKTYRVNNEDINKSVEWLSENKENLPDNSYKGIFKGKNLLSIQFESLEQFVINEKVNGEEITPNLNRLLKNSIYFDNYHEIVNEGTSSDAEFSSNTSLYPIRKGAVAFVYPKIQYNTLPNVLNNNGYLTSIYHPDKTYFWNWAEINSSIGFKKLYDETNYKCTDYIGIGISDACYLNKVADFVKAQQQPFYSFVPTLTSHMPFEMPEEYNELKLDNSMKDTVLAHYLQAIHYSDKQLGMMIDKLDKNGLLDNTVVTIHGDHMGVHKYYNDEVSKMNNINTKWKDKDYRVPLIIYQKNYSFPETIHIPGNQTDFAPTLCYLLGIEGNYYKEHFMGKNLVNTNKNYTLLNDGSILTEKELDEKVKEHVLKSFEISDTIIKTHVER